MPRHHLHRPQGDACIHALYAPGRLFFLKRTDAPKEEAEAIRKVGGQHAWVAAWEVGGNHHDLGLDPFIRGQSPLHATFVPQPQAVLERRSSRKAERAAAKAAAAEAAEEGSVAAALKPGEAAADVDSSSSSSSSDDEEEDELLYPGTPIAVDHPFYLSSHSLRRLCSCCI